MSVFAVGVHNYKRWRDVVTGLKHTETAPAINQQYYDNGGRDWVREKQQTVRSATSPVETNVDLHGH